VADWGSGMSAGCTAGPTVAGLAHANQLPLPRL